MADHENPDDQEAGRLGRWQQTEPLRLHLYGVAVPLVALLVGYGLLSGAMAGLWLAVVAAVLLGGGVELARQFVVAPATARAATRAAVRNAWGVAPGEDTDAVEAAARLVTIRYRIPS